MKACFADNANLPIECVHDIDEVYNCIYATNGITRELCDNWQPERAVNIALDIMGR